MIWRMIHPHVCFPSLDPYGTQCTRPLCFPIYSPRISCRVVPQCPSLALEQLLYEAHIFLRDTILGHKNRKGALYGQSLSLLLFRTPALSNSIFRKSSSLYHWPHAVSKPCRSQRIDCSKSFDRTPCPSNTLLLTLTGKFPVSSTLKQELGIRWSNTAMSVITALTLLSISSKGVSLPSEKKPRGIQLPVEISKKDNGHHS